MVMMLVVFELNDDNNDKKGQGKKEGKKGEQKAGLWNNLNKKA